MESLRARSDARAWAVDLIDRVAVGQGWSATTWELAQEAVEAAWDSTPYVTNPFWGVLSDTGPEFFAALHAAWKTSSTFPDSWNKLAQVWVEAQGYAESQLERDSAAWQAVKDAVSETGEELADLSINVGTGLAGLGLAAVVAWIVVEVF